MIDPPRWTKEQLEQEREKAVTHFRKVRVEEPLEEYVHVFDQYHSVFEDLLESTVDLSDLTSKLSEILEDEEFRDAFRYLAGPPVSEDDLKILAEATLSKRALRADPAMAQRIGQVILSGLDRRRFPWVIAGREPTEEEKHAAAIASASLMATRRVETNRRTEGKRTQEADVRAALSGAGFKEVPPRAVNVLSQGPKPGEFCGESSLGGRKADVLVGLWDERLMPVECKVSNSSTNSVKRLNNDAAAKAETWRVKFGTSQVVPAAVLGGVYKLHNLVSAQEHGLTLFWAHDLQAMLDWIEATRA